MLKPGTYIVISSICIGLTFGCSSPTGNQVKMAGGETKAEQTELQQMTTAGNAHNLSTRPDYSYYENTTDKDRKIGELLDRKITHIQLKNPGLSLSDLPVHNIKVIKPQKQNTYNTEWYVNITFDNDIFNNTDYYYTHGTTIDLAIPNLKKSPVNRIFFAPASYQLEFCGFSITQNIYTPTNPDTENILYGDRPFSAYLLLGQFRETYNLEKNIYTKSQLSLGVLGPSSLGGRVQSSIHEITPIGWQNQINDNFIIDYTFLIKKAVYSSSMFDFNIKANANIGTLYNNLGGGLDFRIGKFMPFYNGPVSAFKKFTSHGNIQYWFYLSTELRLIGYDATIEGGLFNNDNPYIVASSDVNRIIFQSSAGIALYYNNLGIEYEHSYLTPEFKGARHFGWGRIKAVVAF